MQAQLLVGLITPITGSDAFSSVTNNGFLISSPRSNNRSNRRRPHYRLVVASSSSSWAAVVNGEPDHYAVLGVARSATSVDIKRAFRLLARKYHPDVSKDARAAEVFKTIRHAYEVLSNEATRIKYDRALKFQTNTGRSYRGYSSYSPEFEDRVRMYNRWAELRRKMQYERYWNLYNSNKESSFDGETTGKEVEEESLEEERGPFSRVLRSTFLSLFLLKIFGYQISLTYSSLMALFDQKLDSGYKVGHLIAWILGGRGGILLTLCLSFASWVCGKTSSGIVVLVVIAMWVGSNLARCAPLPQGALLALLYMSLKLQSDSS